MDVENMKYFKRQIKARREEIETLQKEINANYKTQTSLYFELRKILEDENNHENKLICNPLKQDKFREYKNILNDYKEKYIEFKKIEEDNYKKINAKYGEINKLKESILTLEKKTEKERSEEFEEKRRNNLESIIGILKDKKQYEQYFNAVNNIMNNTKK